MLLFTRPELCFVLGHRLPRSSSRFFLGRGVIIRTPFDRLLGVSLSSASNGRAGVDPDDEAIERGGGGVTREKEKEQYVSA